MNTLLNWISGDLGPAGRIWTALFPALVLTAYFLGGMIPYAIRYMFKGAYRDKEMESRGESVFANMWVRLYFVWLLQPLWKLVLRSGVPPMAVTTLSVLLALASGISLAAGRFALGGWLYIFSGICDALDGRLARARGKVTKAGGALDSILDRYADGAVLCGLAWFYRDSWILAMVLTALVGSFLVSYIKARGEAAGIVVKVGVMQRAERIIYLGAGCALSPILEVILVPHDPKPLHRLAVIGIVLLAVTTQLTALQRLLYVLSQLSEHSSRKWFEANKRPILRNLTSALVATGLDFALVNVLVLGISLVAPVATAFGCVFGGTINFFMNRMWTFGSKQKKLPQIGRYAFVSVTSAILNSGGVAILLLLPSMDFRIAWALVRLAVFFAWNFPLHRDYVFADNHDAPDTCQGR